MGLFEAEIAPFGISLGSGRRLAKRAKQWLYWLHRWLGVVTCLLCVMWFLSGLVMLYVPFPSWTDAERIENLPAVATDRVRVLPDEAIARSGITSYPDTFRLEMLADEPIYRIVAGDRRVSLSAATGDKIAGVGPEQALSHLRSVFPNSRPQLLEVTEYDQWTVTRRFDPHRPLHKFALNDERGSVVYVSSTTGEIVQAATSSERFWNWIGAVPHWIYFTPVRKNQEFWRQSVMWLSGPLIVGAISGLWIGILRLRMRHPYARGRMTPYRGWTKWHHIGGLVGGAFLAVWIASGWLSVNPFGWFSRTQVTTAQSVAYAGWREDLTYLVSRTSIAQIGTSKASEIAFTLLDGRSLVVGRTPEGATIVDPKNGAPILLEEAALVTAARRALPSAPLRAVELLTGEDLYWYSHHTKRVLPILKLTFDDPSATWLFIDPATGAIAAISNRNARTYRWLFNFLHDYDLPLLLRNQPARDVLVWLLSIAGLVVSVSGVVLGWRTLVRKARF